MNVQSRANQRRQAFIEWQTEFTEAGSDERHRIELNGKVAWGSYNFTSQAEKSNYEVLTITRNAKLAQVLSGQIEAAYQAERYLNDGQRIPIPRDYADSPSGSLRS